MSLPENLALPFLTQTEKQTERQTDIQTERRVDEGKTVEPPAEYASRTPLFILQLKNEDALY